MSILMSVPHRLAYYSFFTRFKIGKSESLNFVLLFQDYFDSWVPLQFCINFKINFFYFYQKKKRRRRNKAIAILVSIVLDLQITLQSIVILTKLNLPIHEHRIFFHLFKQCFIVFSVQVLVEFIPQCYHKWNCLFNFWIVHCMKIYLVLVCFQHSFYHLVSFLSLFRTWKEKELLFIGTLSENNT